MVFLTLSLVDVLFLALGIEGVHSFIKPLLMPSLALAAMLQLLPEHRGKLTWLLLAGLCFHTAGDVLLMFDGRGFIFFAAGLGAFLVGHWLYLCVLMSGIGGLKGWKEFLCLLLPIVLAPVIVSFFGLDWLFSGVVAVYALTLLYLVSSGILWSLRGRAFAIRIILGGALFIISDSLLAVNAFAGVDFLFRHALVMLTYLAAEWFLVSGMVRNRLSA